MILIYFYSIIEIFVRVCVCMCVRVKALKAQNNLFKTRKDGIKLGPLLLGEVIVNYVKCP